MPKVEPLGLPIWGSSALKRRQLEAGNESSGALLQLKSRWRHTGTQARLGKCQIGRATPMSTSVGQQAIGWDSGVDPPDAPRNMEILGPGLKGRCWILFVVFPRIVSDRPTRLQAIGRWENTGDAQKNPGPGRWLDGRKNLVHQ